MVPHQIPSLTALALQYGTITPEQHREIQSLDTRDAADSGDLLITHKFATRYQVQLLQLIRDYLIIKKSGEEFGRLAVEKGFASAEQVEQALARQREAFRKRRVKTMIGDILVRAGVITEEQRDNILEEQQQLLQETDRILTAPQAQEAETPPVQLSENEKQYLQIKAQDKEFAAMVLERGLANERQVFLAQKLQEDRFAHDNQVELLGDIMVEMGSLKPDEKEIILAEQGRMDARDDDEQIPPPQVILSRDQMHARIQRDPRTEMDPDQIQELLAREGIVSGIYPPALLQALAETGAREFPVADMDVSDQLMADMDSRLTDWAPDQEEKKGSPLAQESPRPATYAKPNLLGAPCRVKGGRDTGYRCGAWTRRSRDGKRILAGKSGIPRLDIQRKIHIHPVIHVLEDADLRYGPLEGHAQLTVSGVITGAYPITAGDIRAREIRGATIEAQGDIQVQLGISDAVIRTQGRIQARYLHNCRIESFGDIEVEAEILDSTLLTSGKLAGDQCKIINSQIHAKQGICLAGVGSYKTPPCRLSAGGEEHLAQVWLHIQNELVAVEEKEKQLEEKILRQKNFSKKLFQKMVELKIFHDQSEKKKNTLAKEFKRNAKKFSKDKQKNILNLISNFESRMEKTIHTLKRHNLEKKKSDALKLKLENKLERLLPRLDEERLSLEQDRIAFFKWATDQPGNAKIEIHGPAIQGTRLRGVTAREILSQDREHFFAEEITAQDHTELHLVATPPPQDSAVND